MYRTTIDGKEIIITLAPKIRKEITDRNPLYEAVFHNAARLLQTTQPTFAVNHEIFGLIIGEVQRGESNSVCGGTYYSEAKYIWTEQFFLDNRATGKFVKHIE